MLGVYTTTLISGQGPRVWERSE